MAVIPGEHRLKGDVRGEERHAQRVSRSCGPAKATNAPSTSEAQGGDQAACPASPPCRSHWLAAFDAQIDPLIDLPGLAGRVSPLAKLTLRSPGMTIMLWD